MDNDIKLYKSITARIEEILENYPVVQEVSYTLSGDIYTYTVGDKRKAELNILLKEQRRVSLRINKKLKGD